MMFNNIKLIYTNIKHMKENHPKKNPRFKRIIIICFYIIALKAETFYNLIAFVVKKVGIYLSRGEPPISS